MFEGRWAAGMADASMVQHASEVLGGFVCGRDVFVMVPTGGGKSACLPLVFDKM